MKKLCFVLALLTLLWGSAGALETERLDDSEIDRILSQMTFIDAEENEYLVLPEDYEQKKENRPREKGFTLLILGVDTDEPGVKGRSDTMMLARLTPGKGEMKLVSFMRDLYVPIPGRGRNRLNAAYAFGGPELTKKTLEKCFGVHADGYLAVNFSGMVRLIDAIGGIPVEVEEEELKPLNGILEYYNYLNGRPEEEGRLTEAGNRVLTGLQAMSYARIRKIDNDFERNGRQQRVMMAIFNKVRRLDFNRLADIMSDNIDIVATDVSMNDAMLLMAEVVGLDSVTTRYLRVPVKGSRHGEMVNKAYVVVADLNKNRAALAAFLGEGD